ncbi:MAG: rhamnulokinase [Chloroflexota bacterium]|nr:rhamnulokinase [Chloroflexota bacterium]
MSSARHYLAIDLGAESGRAMHASLADGRLSIEEIHRFINLPVRLTDGYHWDALHQWSEIKAGMAIAARSGLPYASVGLDTWGVDFGLFDRNGALLGNPFYYRDARTDGMIEESLKRLTREEIFTKTGAQFASFNTLNQLLSMALDQSPFFEVAQVLLTMPDMFNYWMSGVVANEFTNATTTQCLNPLTHDWAQDVLEALDIPTRLFQPVIHPGTVLGPLLPDVIADTGLKDVAVVAPSCHDTGSAVVAIPMQSEDCAWISSGTWSILGAEVPEPNLSAQALDYNFANEGSVFGKWRLLKNVVGLWIIQECRRFWKKHGEDLNYTELTRMAEEAQPFLAVIDPDDDVFVYPGRMPEKVREYCAASGQAVPQTKGEILRVVLESLALKYRFVFGRLAELVDRPIRTIHIIGGGSQNRLLNQFTADCTGLPVVTGPVEATAVGNVLMQAIALGHLDSLAEARALVRASFDVETYQPGSRDRWDQAYAVLLNLIK